MYEIHNFTVYSLQHDEQLTKCFLNSISDFLAGPTDEILGWLGDASS